MKLHCLIVGWSYFFIINIDFAMYKINIIEKLEHGCKFLRLGKKKVNETSY